MGTIGSSAQAADAWSQSNLVTVGIGGSIGLDLVRSERWVRIRGRESVKRHVGVNYEPTDLGIGEWRLSRSLLLCARSKERGRRGWILSVFDVHKNSGIDHNSSNRNPSCHDAGAGSRELQGTLL